ncbi:hypothetical protein ACM26V_11135 [Salipaludibacillus sp. HK11]|uniref:hypothetical protein n=1 Tax=Salipaludibacillus sp. HK11 TaxID=3394320 RepID=UPI0039FDA8CA
MSERLLIFMFYIPLFFLLVSCNNGTLESSEYNTEEDTVEVVFEEQQNSLTAQNYKELTEESIILYEAKTPLYITNRYDKKKWFIRLYIQMHEYNENWTIDELFDLAEERYEYEKAWKDYAMKEYSVSVSEEEIESQSSYNYNIYQDNLPPSVRGMSDGLDLSVEEFMLEFDRDHAERSVIWKKLMPLLLEEHQDQGNQRLDGVYLGQIYEDEVSDYMEDEIR